MSVTPPPTIDAPPPAPIRADRTTFSGRVDAFVNWEISLVAQLAAVATNVYNNALSAWDAVTAAFNSATASARSASDAAASAAAAALSTNVTKWAPGAFAEGQCVWSPIDYQNYRCINAGVRNTDPANDATNWRKINYEQPWRVVSGSVSAVAGDKLMFDTRTVQGELILPASPIAGISRIDIADYGNSFGSNKLIINGNGNKIEFLSENSAASKMGFNFGLVYVDATVGWKRV